MKANLTFTHFRLSFSKNALPQKRGLLETCLCRSANGNKTDKRLRLLDLRKLHHVVRDRSVDKVVAHQELQKQSSEGAWLIIKNLNNNLKQFVSLVLIKNCSNYPRELGCSSRVAETIIRDSLVLVKNCNNYHRQHQEF